MAMIEVCVLGSSSSGNATLIAAGGLQILVDAGLTSRAIEHRLADLGRRPADLAGILLTHEHGDHTQGARLLARRHGIPILANHLARDALAEEFGTDVRWQIFQTGEPFRLGPLRVLPFSVPHDSYDPVGFRIELDPGLRLAVVTDLGHATNLVRERLRGCQALILESNHDVRMLQDSPRPWSLKQRILSRQGHLSNAAAAELAAAVAHPGLEHVVLAHLSRDCNDPELARATITAALEQAAVRPLVSLSHPSRVGQVIRVQTPP